LHPGDYFAINVAKEKHAQVVAAVQAQQHWNIAPVDLQLLEAETHEKLAGRTGGAVTLAVGMAAVFARFAKGLMSYWYHFVIMFEALFILTLLETGTRVARFVFQESVSEMGRKPHWGMNVTMSALVCFAWGYLLYTGNINTLWRMLGIANQLLAAIALAVGTTYLINHAPKRSYALCTGIPFVFVLATVVTAGVQSVQGWWSKIPSAPAGEVFSLQLMSVLASIMLGLTVLIALDAARRWFVLLAGPRRGEPVAAIAVTETV
jgi:carbon starvation protein